jgi:hypothetical protein
MGIIRKRHQRTRLNNKSCPEYNVKNAMREALESSQLLQPEVSRETHAGIINTLLEATGWGFTIK